jgi:hypothetical protein
MSAVFGAAILLVPLTGYLLAQAIAGRVGWLTGASEQTRDRRPTEEALERLTGKHRCRLNGACGRCRP